MLSKKEKLAKLRREKELRDKMLNEGTKKTSGAQPALSSLEAELERAKKIEDDEREREREQQLKANKEKLLQAAGNSPNKKRVFNTVQPFLNEVNINPKAKIEKYVQEVQVDETIFERLNPAKPEDDAAAKARDLLSPTQNRRTPGLAKGTARKDSVGKLVSAEGKQGEEEGKKEEAKKIQGIYDIEVDAIY